MDSHEQVQEQIEDGLDNVFNDQKHVFRALIKTRTPGQLGHLIEAYVDGAEDAGWEGFSREERVIVGKLFFDIVIAEPHLKDPDDSDLIYRDEMVAAMVRMAAAGDTESELFDKINEAIRDSIDIDRLREMAAENGVAAIFGI